ncbi:energy-coupling factor ABC transporter ATP-binding protein [Shewanella sp. 10N.7]|uniref:ATP-binding cassette domain-containing protein n=1 Tax=Shewanella sp. 10N.7 TaxID=2885093 RepID=UPI001E3D5D40|nr:ABC transporter ATP-binding protein [Shewanella sp. 10N.7]MCC4832026.1 energy-coupling factor ABC transporter ATP-binding protein [Shewanella sp. 10N.7]
MSLLALHGVSYRHHSSSIDLFNQLDLTVAAGECHCILGVTGAGKSTLLQLIAMPNDVDFDGQIIHHPNLRLGLVMQDPNIQLIRESIGAEVAFGLENLAYSVNEMFSLVEHALAIVGLGLPLDTLVSHLSLGQKYRLMLAAQLVLNPNLLLLDEPWAQLDNSGVSELNLVLQRLVDSGVSVIMTEHHADAFAEVIQTYWLLAQGQLTLVEANSINAVSASSILKGQCCESNLDFSVPNTNSAANTQSLITDEVCATENRLSIFPLKVQFENQTPVVEIRKTLHLNAGDIVGLFGENGSGKSSLLNQIAGIDDSNQADILLFGKPAKFGRFNKDLGLLMQRPSRQLFEVTVRQELEFSLKRFHLPLSRVNEILEQLEISHLATQSPHKLSYGQQHLVALASVLCVKPKVLLLDDPFAGLDEQYFTNIISMLTAFSRHGGTIIITSHRPILEAQLTQYWQIENGQLTTKALL